MGWKIYFWIFAILSIIGILNIIGEFLARQNNLYSGFLVIILLTTLTLLSIYAYAYKKKVFSRQGWKFLFWLLLIVTIEDLLWRLNLLPDTIVQALSFLETGYKISTEMALIGIIIGNIPSLYATYQLGYKKA